MVEDPRVYEIDLTKKYILIVSEGLKAVEAARIRHELDEWIKNDQPFCLLMGNVKLVRVDIADQPESEE